MTVSRSLADVPISHLAETGLYGMVCEQLCSEAESAFIGSNLKYDVPISGAA